MVERTITSKLGVIYYDIGDLDDISEAVAGRLYYDAKREYNRYYTKNPANEVYVIWDDYYVYDVENDDITETKIDIETTYIIKNTTTDERLTNQTADLVKEYFKQFSSDDTESNDSDNYVNETGHTEDTEELVDGRVTLFDTDNIVEEEMFEVHITDDEYHGGEHTDTNSIIQDFVALEDATTLMSSTTSDATDDGGIVEVEDTEDIRTSKNTIEAAVGIVSAVDLFGHYLTKGGTCPVCGKKIKWIPGNGYCSLECAGKDLLKKLESAVSGDYETETPKIIEQIKNVLNYFNLALNVITKVPDILASIAKLPLEYKDYATAKINIIFLEIKKIINKLLIKKNELIIKLLKRIKFGTIDDKLQPVFAVINQIIQAVQVAKAALENALAVAYNAITKVSGMFYIGPQEYGFFWTLKSNMAICPYYKTDATVYPPGLLGKPFWGLGTMNIAFDMSLCQLSIDIGAKSALLNVDFTKINAIIRKAFLPILSIEYLMDPDLFDVRLALSDLNAPAIEKLVKILEKLIVIGGDFIPTYENLSLVNIWYVVAILTCWGPWTRSIFGDFIFHGFI